jgi:uncharacterized protein
MKSLLALPATLIGLTLAGCAAEQPATLANPAAQFCAAQGGTHEIRRDAAGAETGVCILASGQEVDAWEFYRENARI